MPPAPPFISKLPLGSFFVGYAELPGEWVPFFLVSRKIRAMSLSPYLDKKAARLQHELQSLEHTQQLSEQGKTHLPIARTKLEEITAGYRGIIQAKKQRVLKAAQQEAQEKANLRSLDQDPKFSKKQAYTVMALVLGLALMFMLTGIFLLQGGLAWAVAIVSPLAGVAIVAYLYRIYAERSQVLYTKARASTPTRTLDFIGRYRLCLLQFAPGYSGHFTYNYHCTFIEDEAIQSAHAAEPRHNIMQIWKLDREKYGDLYGATLVGIKDNHDDDKVAILLRIPESSQDEVGVIELREGARHALRGVLPDFERYLRRQGSSIADAVSPLTEAIAHYGTQTKREEELTAALEEIDNQRGVLSQIGVEPEIMDGLNLQMDAFKKGGHTAPRGILVYGPHGTSQDKIVITMANAWRCAYLKMDWADLNMGGRGSAAVKTKQLWQRAHLMSPCVVFVDDLEQTIGGHHEKNSPEHEVVETFLAEWNESMLKPGRVLVMAATNKRESVDMTVLLRFTQSFEIGLPSPVVRERVLRNEFSQAGLYVDVTRGMVEATTGMVHRELQQLALRLRGMTDGDHMDDTMFETALRSIRGQASTTTASVTWEGVILPNELKEKLQYLAKKIKRSEEYAQRGLPISKSLLLYGPPGTGKTQIARALATESGLSFMAFTTADIKSGTAGESGGRVQALFHRARSQSPCLLFIDEIDILTARRTAEDKIGQEIVGQFLQEMDGINTRSGGGQVFVIGATNHRNIMDAAVLSRFSEQEEVALPTFESRAEMLMLYLKDKPVDFHLRGVAIRVAAATEGFSGRDLAALVNAVAAKAMQRADAQHLDIEDVKLTEMDFIGMEIDGKVVDY